MHLHLLVLFKIFCPPIRYTYVRVTNNTSDIRWPLSQHYHPSKLVRPGVKCTWILLSLLRHVLTRLRAWTGSNGTTTTCSSFALSLIWKLRADSCFLAPPVHHRGHSWFTVVCTDHDIYVSTHISCNILHTCVGGEYPSSRDDCPLEAAMVEKIRLVYINSCICVKPLFASPNPVLLSAINT